MTSNSDPSRLWLKLLALLIGVSVCVLAMSWWGSGVRTAVREQLGMEAPSKPRQAEPKKPPNPRHVLEAALKKRGMLLLSVSDDLAEQDAARCLRFDRETLKTHTLYLLDASSATDFLYIDEEGGVQRAGKRVVQLEREGMLVAAAHGRVLFVDDVPFDIDFTGWKQYWVARDTSMPILEEKRFPHFEFSDGFMRLKLEDSNWRTTSGLWQLNKHGGGMPRTEQLARKAGVPRAANPFDVLGSENGMLTHDEYPLAHGHVEARFYFGIPRQSKVIDTRTLPLKTDQLVVVGEPNGAQVAFGWRGESRSYVLLTREADKPWKKLEAYEGKRPAITSWVNVGLTVRCGAEAIGVLDGVEVVRALLPRRVMGPFHIACGTELVQMDDVKAWSIPRGARKGSPVFVRSRLFAVKKEKRGSDPSQFGEWSRGTKAFARFLDESKTREALGFIAVRRPLYGDFLYESVPYEAEAGDLPEGLYEFRLLKKTVVGRSKAREHEAAFAVRFKRTAQGWQAVELAPDVWPEKHREFTLRMRRAEADGNRIAVRVGENFVPLSDPLDGPVHLSIGRVYPPGTVLDGWKCPMPEHHAVFDPHLRSELFEEAPTEWSWIDGKFRMDCRWACSDQWNFMACGSTAVPFMVSKATYHGDQEHDYFMSLRPVYPWDAGDATFKYEPRKDRGWRIFRAHDGWYNRHDLNFSFCSDGKNPLSGYAVVFGGDGNTETRLLRKGKIVARASASKFLFPRQKQHSVIHWKWWHFDVVRHQKDILVYLNDKVMLRYTDPEPLEGGHVGFWSVRNGFTVSRVNSAAEILDRKPHVLYVADDTPSDWKPLLADGVTLSKGKDPGMTRVTLNSGAGFHGVRYTFNPPIDLRGKPLLELPVNVPEGLKLNLHLDISGQSYLISLTGPLEATKSLLTVRYEKGEQFRIADIARERLAARCLTASCPPGGTIRCDLLKNLVNLRLASKGLELRSIAIGNTSNHGYLLAGSGGNTGGMVYEVGTPVLLGRDIDELDARK